MDNEKELKLRLKAVSKFCEVTHGFISQFAALPIAANEVATCAREAVEMGLTHDEAIGYTRVQLLNLSIEHSGSTGAIIFQIAEGLGNESPLKTKTT